MTTDVFFRSGYYSHYLDMTKCYGICFVNVNFSAFFLI